MKSIIKMALAAVVIAVGAMQTASAQQVAGVRSGLAVGANKVTIVEQSDVAQTVRAVEQRKGRTKVNGYTILILSDNSETARENANKAKGQKWRKRGLQRWLRRGVWMMWIWKISLQIRYLCRRWLRFRTCRETAL